MIPAIIDMPQEYVMLYLSGAMDEEEVEAMYALNELDKQSSRVKIENN